MIALSLALVVAVAVCIMLALELRRERSGRRAALGLLGAPKETPLPTAVERELRSRVPRAELTATLHARDAAFEAIPTAVLVVDGHRRIERANEGAREMLPCATVGTAAADVSPSFAAAVDVVVSGFHAQEREVMVGEDDDHRTFRAHLRSYPDADGSGRAVVAVLFDITSAVDFRESRRLFSAAVSHELRTPLARILGLAETLALPLDEEERRALVAQTEIEVDNMRRLVDEMLLLAAIDRGDATFSESVTDVSLAVAGVVSDRRARPSGRGRSIDVDVVTGLGVHVNERLLETVIGNLVDNALRHAGPAASVRLLVRGLAGEVEIAVSDDGVGIDRAHLPHVFERFYRGDASRTGPGTGLGLAIVKHIVEANGGRVGVESEPRAGTTVRITLPEAIAPRVPTGD